MSSKQHAQCFAFDAEPRDIKKCIREGHHVLIVLRGVSGAGKTALANEFVSESTSSAVLSSDGPHLTRSVRCSVSQDSTPLVIVDTENIARSKVKELARIGLVENYEVFVVEPRTAWRYDAEHCASIGTRGETIDAIRTKIETIRDETIAWDHLVAGGEKNVKIVNFHDDDDDDNAEDVSVSVVTKSPPPVVTTTQRADASSTSSSSPFPSPSSSTATTLPLSTSTPPAAKLFSLMPRKVMKEVRSVGTQVIVDSMVRGLADAPEWDECVDVGEVTSVESPPKQHEVRRIDRCQWYPEDVRTSRGDVVPATPLMRGTSEEIEFAMLRRIFRWADVNHIHHYLQMFGFVDAFRILHLTGDDWLFRGSPTDDGRYELVGDDGWLFELVGDDVSRTVGNWTADEEMERLRIQREEINLLEYRYVESLNTDSPSEASSAVATSSDEQIARILHDELNGFDGGHVQPDEQEMSRDDDTNLRHLRLVFPNTDADVIANAYEIAVRNVATAAEFLRDSGEPENHRAQPATCRRPATWSGVVGVKPADVPIDGPPKTAAEKANHFLQVRTGSNRITLDIAQRLAVDERVRIDQARGYDRQEMVRCDPRFRAEAVMERARTRRAMAGELVMLIDNQLRQAHESPFSLDLHYMSAVGAKKLVVEAIEAVRYLQKGSRAVSDRITVVTGAGNNSKNGAKIKPQVMSMLRTMGVAFSELNAGCLCLRVTA